MLSVVIKLMIAIVLAVLTALVCLQPGCTFAAASCELTFPDSTVREVGANPRDLVVHDLDGDGNLDLITVEFDPLGISILRGIGDGTFGPEQRCYIGASSYKLAVGDLDSDGYKDIVVTMEEVAHLGVFWGGPGGEFDSLAAYRAVGNFAMHVADMDQDGRDDIVFTTDREDAMNVIWGNGTRTLAERTSYPVQLRPFFVALGDMNGDHLPDIAMNEGDNIIYKITNLGQRQFSATSVAMTCPLEVSYLTFGSLNGDSYGDLAVIGFSLDGTSVAVGLGSEGGQFSAVPVLVPGRSPVRVVVSDLNGDGNGDLVVGCQTSQDARIMLGNGDGTFYYLTRLWGEACVGDVGAGDLNGDGSPDVVVMAACSYKLTIHRNSQRFTVGTVRFSPFAYSTGRNQVPLTAQVALPAPFTGQWDAGSVSLLWRGSLLGSATSVRVDGALGAATYTFPTWIMDAVAPGDQTLAVVGCDSTGAVFRAESRLRVVAATTTGTYWQSSRPGSIPVTIQVTGLFRSPVTYRVYDCRGRQVRRGLAQVPETGVLLWDTRSSQDIPLPSGAYIFRLDGRARGCKVIVLR